MTPHAPTPPAPATRTRIKWDNIAVVGFGVVLATFAVVAVMISSAPTAEPAATTVPKPAATAAPVDGAAEEPRSPDALTLEDAQGLVDDARSLMAEGRWDEAVDRLETVPAEYRDATGADELATRLSTLRESHRTLRAELDAAVEARQWGEARDLLRRIARIAPLDAPLLEVQAAVDAALAPAAKDAGAGASDRPRAKDREKDRGTSQARPRPAGGGAASATPAAASARPAGAGTTRPTASGGTRPAAGGGGASRPGTPGPGTTRPPAAAKPPTLTPAQQQQLEAALAEALAGAEAA